MESSIISKQSENTVFSLRNVSGIYIRWDAMIVAFVAAFALFSCLSADWLTNDKLALLTEGIRPSIPVIPFIVSLLLSALLFVVMYIPCCRIADGLHCFIKGNLFTRRRGRLSNLIRNCYFPVSAIFFFCINDMLTIEYRAGAVFGVIGAAAIAAEIPSMISVIRKSSVRLCILSLLTSLGICWEGVHNLRANWYAFIIKPLELALPIQINVSVLICMAGAGAAVFYVFFFVLAFWKEMTKIFREYSMFDEVNGSEWLLYGVLYLLSVVYIVAAFSRTDAFYGTPYFYDIIYTSDSPFLVKESVYLSLAHLENDIRQPLFAVFSAPFMGIPYLIGELCGGSATTFAILNDVAQSMLLLTANFILAKMLRLGGVKRMCFMVMTSFTYTQLLFVLMMEQYIVAYFWLMLCLYLICENNRPKRMTLWATGGTLLTGMILLPSMSDNLPHKRFKEWFVDMVTCGLEFVALLFVFARFDTIWGVISRLLYLGEFSGRSVTFPERTEQYTVFIKNCFIAPDAYIHLVDIAPPSWKQMPVTGISYIGVAILIFVVISFVLNRQMKSSQITMAWIVFSVLILVCFGWGTQENGLILYALYFGWAYFALLFQLLQWAENKLQVKFLLYAATVVVTVAFAATNIPAMLDIIRFGITYYPL